MVRGQRDRADGQRRVVVASKGKVTASFAYQTVNETDAGKVKDAVKKVVGK